MEFTVTKTGGKKLLFDGYAHILNKSKNDLCYWKNEKKGKFKGKIITKNNIIQGEYIEHSHHSNPNHNLLFKTIEEIKYRAIRT